MWILLTAALLSCSEAERIVSRIDTSLFTPAEVSELTDIIWEFAPRYCYEAQETTQRPSSGGIVPNERRSSGDY